MSIFNQLKPAFLQDSENSQASIPERLNFRRIWKLALILTSIVTLLPLIIITVIDYQFTQKSIESENLLRTLRVGSNAKRAVSHFLHERFSALSYVVHSNSYESLKNHDNLTAILNNLNKSFGDFSDLGLINSKGVQSNYVGPYNLAGEDYSREDCFDEVAVRGHFVSEAFLGFRNSPHAVVSVRHDLPRGSFYVLRTALETSLLGDLLGSYELDGRGDMFLINSQGVIQTPTLYHGQVFDRLPFAVPKYSEHTEVEESVNDAGEKVLLCSAYIPDSPFILIIIKNKEELMKPWRDARLKLIGFLLASITV
ncbi:MAG: cache domain-containing protein, partial [Desulforhopalus sp.]|nr:cache domain-containing protein [Desulforhopalus sp.]